MHPVMFSYYNLFKYFDLPSFSIDIGFNYVIPLRSSFMSLCNVTALDITSIASSSHSSHSAKDSSSKLFMYFDPIRSLRWLTVI